MRLQTLLTREHSAAEFALDVARRRASLHHEIRDSVGAWPSATVALESDAFSVTPGPDARTYAVLPVLGRRARAARTEINARVLTPVPRVKRVAGATLQHLRRRSRLPFRRAQFHVALALVFALAFSLGPTPPPLSPRGFVFRYERDNRSRPVGRYKRPLCRRARYACRVQLVNRQNTYVSREPREMADACARIHGSFNRVREPKMDGVNKPVHATREACCTRARGRSFPIFFLLN